MPRNFCTASKPSCKAVMFCLTMCGGTRGHKFKYSLQLSYQERFDSLYKQLSEQLDQTIYNFAENHYEDDRVNENWQQRLQNLKFDEKYQNLLKSLAEEC